MQMLRSGELDAESGSVGVRHAQNAFGCLWVPMIERALFGGLHFQDSFSARSQKSFVH